MRIPGTRRCAAALALGLGLVLSGCGGQEDGPAAESSGSQVSATEHNEADVAFATEMIQHHAQALAMVDLTMGRPLDPEVTELAEAIRAAQAPEIETMTDWLTEWGEEIPATVRDHANAGHDMGAMDDSMGGMESMPGAMSAEEMQALQDAPDADFQQLWLEQMIEHHQGAVEMARAEQQDGRYQPAVDLAGDIVSSQSAEIETMQSLLDR